MRPLLLTLVVATFLTLSLEARPSRQLTSAALPRIETLQQLGLKKRWHVYVPVDGTRDGIAVAQVIDGQFVVQTFSGSLIALDAETGRTQWRARFDQPYGAQKEEVAHNSRMFFVASNARLFGVDRVTGNAEWTYTLPGVLATAPVADIDRLYICTALARVFAYQLPVSQAELRGQAAVQSYGSRVVDKSLNPTTLTHPEPIWQFQLETPVLQPPALFGTHLVFADGKGTLFSFQKDQRALADVIKSPTRISAPLSRQGTDQFYVASEDHNIYCYRLETGSMRPMWTYQTGHRVLQKPMPIGQDVFVAVENGGLHCIDSTTGQRRWVQPRGARFLGASKRLVCVGDSQGRTLVLDRQKGQVAGSWDSREFAMQVENPVSNRIFFANHDGLILCLQDLDTGEDQPAFYHEAPKTEEKKPVEPPAEEKPKEPAKKDEKAAGAMDKEEK
jgi:outer membrane protein assembly factor BamB